LLLEEEGTEVVGLDFSPVALGIYRDKNPDAKTVLDDLTIKLDMCSSEKGTMELTAAAVKRTSEIDTVKVKTGKETLTKLFQQFCYRPIYLAFNFFFSYWVEKQENLKGLEGKSLIVAANHASSLDGVMLSVSMPRG